MKRQKVLTLFCMVIGILHLEWMWMISIFGIDEPIWKASNLGQYQLNRLFRVLEHGIWNYMIFFLLPYLCTPRQKIFFQKAQPNVATYLEKDNWRVNKVLNFLYQESVSLCDSKKYKSSMWELIQRPFLDDSCLKSVLHNSSVPLLECIQTLE